MTEEAKSGKPRHKRQGPLPAAEPDKKDGHGPDAGEAREAASATSTAAASGPSRSAEAPIVGIGASAGGLAAIERFLSAMSPEAERALALVLVQHLDPDRKSLLADLVRQYTHMKVLEVRDGMEVEAGSAYVIPPNRDMALVNGKLSLLEPSSPRGLRLPIDFFFRSLAQDRREKAAGIVLSGTGTDGTLGLKAIKENGGLIMVQSPDSAQYDGMPRSAIATGLVDFVLPPDEMPARLYEYAKRTMGELPRPVVAALEREAAHNEPLLKIFMLLRSRAGHDFSRYKQNTIVRRIERRMAVHQIETLDGYVSLLQQNPAEITILFRELLIGVTNFFRDPDAFSVLADRVIPAIFAKKGFGESVRVWVPGCSTGEEAYSIAMLLQEQMSKVKADVRAQVFATDIDTGAIDQARAGIYPNNIAADVSPERLSRFFAEEGSTYHIKKAIRDMVVFASQNVAEDPPFSRIDLVSCRNLLIYMNTDLQRRVVPLFHYALNPMGYLMLGTSESIGDFSDLFAPVDRKWKIFVRKPGGLPHRAPVNVSRAMVASGQVGRRPMREGRQESRLDVRQDMERALLALHTPPAVVANSEGDVLYIHGRTGYYLEPAQGEASLNILRMAREGLRLELTAALRKAIATQDKVVHGNLLVRTNGAFQAINLIVQPMPEVPIGGLYLIVFEPAPAPPEQAAPPPEQAAHTQDEVPLGDKDQRISVLERQLRSKEEYLQTTIEELETSNEELTSTNEELQSANEELQSTNEEMETSKEELQSVNEELMTVNTELQKKIEELSRLNNDLNNLLAGTGIGTVFVDYQLRIQRFTPAATEIINLIQSDVGRPVAHIVSNLSGYTDLIKDVTSVLDKLAPKEREVQAQNGRWYLMRIQPYRTLENVIEGAVLTFVDITSQKKMQAALEAAQHLWLDSLFEPALIVDATGKVLDWSDDALVLLGYEADELRTLRLLDLSQPDGYSRLRQAIAQTERGTKSRLGVRLHKKDGAVFDAEVRMRQLEPAVGGGILVVVYLARAMEDVRSDS